MSCPYEDRIVGALWSAQAGGEEPDVFAVLDGARDPRIQPTLFRNPGNFCCVENARLAPKVRAAAPQLVRLKHGDGLTSELLEGGWGESWGIFARARHGFALEAMRRHFHGLLRVRDEEGRVMVFRYYDPRVLRVFLPTCSREQLEEFFGPVEEYCVESEDRAGLIRYRFDGRRLDTRTLELVETG